MMDKPDEHETVAVAEKDIIVDANHEVLVNCVQNGPRQISTGTLCRAAATVRNVVPVSP